MVKLVDTSQFPVGVKIDYESRESIEGLMVLEAEARAYMENDSYAPPIADIVLAFGIAPILGLYLVQFQPGGKVPDPERWLVVGDLPSIHFETDYTPTPAGALKWYCLVAQEWADHVLADGDLSECYPIDAAPTHEHAEMLLSRIDFIRRKLIPLAKPRRTRRGGSR